jgi:hypothetical protein
VIDNIRGQVYGSSDTTAKLKERSEGDLKMRNRPSRFMFVMFLLLSLLGVAQAVQRPAHPDLSGIWLRQSGTDGISTMPPQFTPAGMEAAKKNMPAARSRSTYIKSVDKPELSNDPALKCNPKGFPRIVLDAADQYHEMITLPNRILQLWQEERRPREIWTDGRVVPSGENLDDLGPGWYGHSVGQWQGDTLVVTTVGLDDRAWVDSFGFPKSVDARVEERYKLVGTDMLQLQLTLIDPTYYRAPWVSDTKTWKKQPPEKTTSSGWQGLFSGAGELICAPANGGRISKKNP